MRRILFGLVTTAALFPGWAPSVFATPMDDFDLDDVEEIAEHDPEPIPGYENVPLVRLSDVVSSPDAFHSTPFRFVGQFYDFGELYSPFYTVFEPGEYYNFAVWGGDDPLWIRERYVDPHSLVYMNRKNRTQAQRLINLKKFDRFHAVGIVRSSFRSRAWIEILSVDPVSSKLDRKTLTNFVYGYRLKSAGEFDLASLRFAEACDNESPVFARRAARLEEGRCLVAAGAFIEATQVFARGMKEFPFSQEFRDLHGRSVASLRTMEGRASANADDQFGRLTIEPTKPLQKAPAQSTLEISPPLDSTIQLDSFGSEPESKPSPDVSPAEETMKDHRLDDTLKRETLRNPDERLDPLRNSQAEEKPDTDILNSRPMRTPLNFDRPVGSENSNPVSPSQAAKKPSGSIASPTDTTDDIKTEPTEDELPLVGKTALKGPVKSENTKKESGGSDSP